MLFSGYDPCDVRDHDKDGDTEHKYNSLAGLARPSTLTGSVYHSDYNDRLLSGNEDVQNYRDCLVALHEISHCPGATKENYIKVDEDHGECIMSGNNTDKTMYKYFTSGSAAQYEGLYCDNCFAAIAEFIKYY